MSVTVVVGAQWGDEGKGRVVDYLAVRADLVIRFQGGDNAGHTVVNDRGRFALHLIPCGIFYPGVRCRLGAGTVVNLEGRCAGQETGEEPRPPPVVGGLLTAGCVPPGRCAGQGTGEERAFPDCWTSGDEARALLYFQRSQSFIFERLEAKG